ncbi:MAG: acetate--CoA ligase family protein [Gemmatimonadota bacterium]
MTIPTKVPSASLDSILKPRSVAVIGASRTAGTIGSGLIENLVRHGYTGRVYPINPHATAIHSLPAYPSIADVPGDVDLAVVAVPRESVLEVVEACGVRGVKGVVVITAGFRESGSDGAAREAALLEVVRRHGMRMIGPNCMGVLNADPAISLNATLGPAMPPLGSAAFLSQSGALGLSVLDYAHEFGIGIAQFASIGNTPDVNGNDLLEYWEKDPAVGVILMYVETFGDSRKFLSIASRVTRQKPIIVVKSGRGRVSAVATESHTGTLLERDAAVGSLLTQAGVLRADSVEELFDLAMGFTGRPLPRSRRTAVLTNSAGPGMLAADALIARGMEVAPINDATLGRLRPLVHSDATLRNPLDMLPSATPAAYGTALDLLLTDGGVDSLLAVFVPPVGVSQREVAEAIASVQEAHPDKPVFAVLMGREGLPQGRAELREARVPAYIFPESAARALGALCLYREGRDRVSRSKRPLPVDRDRAARILQRAARAGHDRLDEFDALELLAAYGIPVAPARLAQNAQEAVESAEELGDAVVLKVVSPVISHKSDVGGVRTGLRGAAQIRRAFDEIVANVRRTNAMLPITGIMVQKMVEGGRETIIGIARDPEYGPLLMFGLGGIFVEALRDVVFRAAPVLPLDAYEMVRGIRGFKILEGVRGEAPADLTALQDALLRVSQLAVDFPAVAELDINPLLAFRKGVIAVDARVGLARNGDVERP